MDNTTKPIKVAAYIRVSTTDQAREGYSLPAQTRSIKIYCDKNNYELYNIYADEGISGKDFKHRNAMLQLLDDVKAQKFDIVCVWALSRFTRSVADLYTMLTLLNKYNVEFVSLTESFDTSTAMGRAMLGIIGVFAQLERELTGERVALAAYEKVMRGGCPFNYALGYDRNGDNLTINVEEAKIVRFIFKTYLKTKSMSEVSRQCKAHGYHGKLGGNLNCGNIEVILRKVLYCGYYTYHKQPIKADFEPIISIDTYNAVQDLIAKNRKGRWRKHPLIYLPPKDDKIE